MAQEKPTRLSHGEAEEKDSYMHKAKTLDSGTCKMQSQKSGLLIEVLQSFSGQIECNFNDEQFLGVFDRSIEEINPNATAEFVVGIKLPIPPALLR